MIKSIGATQSGGVIKIPKAFTTTELGDPYNPGSGKANTVLKSSSRLQEEQAEAARLFGELKTIESDLIKLQNKAERQTNLKIPSLGSGSRQ